MMFSENSVVFCDADSLFFRPCAAISKDGLKRNWKKDVRMAINHTINVMKRECMTDTIMYAVKGSGNFRKDIYPEYKANRPELNDNLRTALNYGHSYMCDFHNAVRADGMEADDLVSIWAREAMGMGRDYTIAGIDKDLLQIPGNHYNFVKVSHQYVDEETAYYNLMLQCLTGDTTDNIPGIKGIGPAKASKLLSGVPAEAQWGHIRQVWATHNAGDPVLTRHLLEMLKSFEEEDIVRDTYTSEAAVSEPDVHEREEEEDGSLPSLPRRDQGRTDRSKVAVQR